MSEIINIHGECGKELDFKLWKQGGSVKCLEGESSIIRYPKPDDFQIYFVIRSLCNNCESIDSDKKRSE